MRASLRSSLRSAFHWYGGEPLHLLVLVASLAVTAYVVPRLVSGHIVGVVVWFVGAAILHDLLLFPLYALADRSMADVLRRRASARRNPRRRNPVVNYVRVPAALSGLLFLVWFPLILRLPFLPPITTTTTSPYLWHWLLVTAALFALSALTLAFRLRRGSRDGR